MRFLGPPPLAILIAIVASASAFYGLFVVPSNQPVLAAILIFGGFGLAWRLLTHSVSVDHQQVVVRNLWRKHRLPIHEASVAIGCARYTQDHMWHGQAGQGEPLPVVGVPGRRKLRVWVYDLSGSNKPVQVGCLIGRSPLRLNAGYQKLAKVVEDMSREATVFELGQRDVGLNELPLGLEVEAA